MMNPMNTGWMIFSSTPIMRGVRYALTVAGFLWRTTGYGHLALFPESIILPPGPVRTVSRFRNQMEDKHLRRPRGRKCLLTRRFGIGTTCATAIGGMAQTGSPLRGGRAPAGAENAPPGAREVGYVEAPFAGLRVGARPWRRLRLPVHRAAARGHGWLPLLLSRHGLRQQEQGDPSRVGP